MAKIWFILLSTLVFLGTISARSRPKDTWRRAVKGVSHYIGNMDAISTDLMKDKEPKEDCVFYVNSDEHKREKALAIAFAEMRNQQLTAGGGRATANTLYDAFHLELAFGSEGALMQEASGGGQDFLRTYFKVTSGAYARLCRGTVWLIVKKDVPIYEDAIWLTHEYPQLIRAGSGVTAIWEIDPQQIEYALALNNPNHDLNPTPYRGGLPPGTTPPRSVGTIKFDKKDVPGIQAKIDQYAKYPDVADGKVPPKPSAKPQCDMSDSSRVPFNVFNGVFGKFCESTKSNPPSPLSQIVDSRGYVIPPKKRSLSKRTPPPNPDAYKDYKFSLSWSGGKGDCALSCGEAFNAASSSPCGHTAGGQNIMATSGTVEAGCGQYKWTIAKPLGSDSGPSPPKVAAVECNAADRFGKHGDVNRGLQSLYAAVVCGREAGKNLKPGDPDVVFEGARKDGTDYNYKISWLPGCKSTVPEMSVTKPLPDDDKNTCSELLRRTYTDCNNGGVGGSIDVGCLRYEFHP